MHSNAASPPASDAEGDSMVVDGPVKKYRYFGLASESDEEDSEYKPDAVRDVDVEGNAPDTEGTAVNVEPASTPQTSNKKLVDKVINVSFGCQKSNLTWL